MDKRSKKLTCFLFGEGRKDKNFIIALKNHVKFKYHTRNWEFNYDNAYGSSPKVIATQCKKAVQQRDYDLIMCFLDTDKLKHDFPKTWQKEKEKLENDFSPFIFIWFEDNAEDEFRKVLGELTIGKQQLNKKAKQNIDKFVNSDLWKRILEPINEYERLHISLQ